MKEEEIRNSLKEAGEQDSIVLLVSGGGSALLEKPEEGLTLDDIQQVTEQLLRAHAWNFATRYATLSKQGTPEHGYTQAYLLPADCLRVLDVRPGEDARSPQARFSVTGARLYCNISPCNARYVARVLDPAAWPADFADAVATRLAAEIAPLSAQSFGLGASLLQLAQLAFQQAQASDAAEQRERLPAGSPYVAVR